MTIARIIDEKWYSRINGFWTSRRLKSTISTLSSIFQNIITLVRKKTQLNRVPKSKNQTYCASSFNHLFFFFPILRVNLPHSYQTEIYFFSSTRPGYLSHNLRTILVIVSITIAIRTNVRMKWTSSKTFISSLLSFPFFAHSHRRQFSSCRISFSNYFSCCALHFGTCARLFISTKIKYQQ